jgi:hypothetical protein
MTHSQPSSDWLKDDQESWEVRGIEEETWGQAVLDCEGGPALAATFRITDLQHWLDLCA